MLGWYGCQTLYTFTYVANTEPPWILRVWPLFGRCVANKPTNTRNLNTYHQHVDKLWFTVSRLTHSLNTYWYVVDPDTLWIRTGCDHHRLCRTYSINRAPYRKARHLPIQIVSGLVYTNARQLKIWVMLETLSQVLQQFCWFGVYSLV